MRAGVGGGGGEGRGQGRAMELLRGNGEGRGWGGGWGGWGSCEEKSLYNTLVLSIRGVNLLRLLLLFHINESEKFLLSPALMSKRPNLRVEYILIRPLIKMRLTGSFIPPA